MDFDELNSLAVAVRTTNITFDYFARSLEMIIKPEYGVSRQIDGKVFQLRFNDCIYLGCVNTSEFAAAGQTEFISWGKSTFDSLKVIEALLSQTISADFTNFGFERLDLNRGYDFYFFENTLGDALEVVCSNVTVRELSVIEGRP